MLDIPTLAVHDGAVVKLLKINDIMYVTAEGSYTNLYLSDGEKMVLSKNLKNVVDNLPKEYFIRVHHSVVVNLAYASAFENGNFNILHLKNGEEISISRNKKQQFLDRFVKL